LLADAHAWPLSRLLEEAAVVRAKNAGPFVTTIDVFFADPESYSRLEASGILTKESVAKVYDVGPEKVLGVYFVPSVLGVKISLLKNPGAASGDSECRDVFGAQQHVPLLFLGAAGQGGDLKTNRSGPETTNKEVGITDAPIDVRRVDSQSHEMGEK
jgi:hypothetical protein